MSEPEHLSRHASHEKQMAPLKSLAFCDFMPLVDLEVAPEEMRGMTECEKYGYTYGCDSECPVFMRGECKHADEMEANE